MTYRNDHEALFAYHDNLVRDLADVDGRLKDLEDAAATRQRLAAELARVRAELSSRAEKLQPIRLRKVSVARPCKEDWDGMVGDDQVRHCKRCDKPVYNLSEMTAGDAEAVLAAHGTTPCVRFYQRADGTVKTADCPRPASWAATAAATATAAGALAVTAAGALVLAGGDAPRRMGEMVPLSMALPAPPPPETLPINDPGDWIGGVVAVETPPPAPKPKTKPTTRPKYKMGRLHIPKGDPSP